MREKRVDFFSEGLRINALLRSPEARRFTAISGPSQARRNRGRTSVPIISTHSS